MAETKIAIVPLTGANYPTWKIQCKMSLIKDGLWEIVDGSEEAPQENDGAYSKFIARKNRALAIIVLSIDPSLLYLLGDPTDPTAVWEKLSTQFQKKTWANKLALRRRLHSLQLKEGQSVQEHVKALTEIFNELSVIGDNIDDEDRVVYLLASLPDSYEMLVTALEANTEVPNMETVIERLLHEEQKVKERNQSSLPSRANSKEEVMTVKHKKKGPRCNFCKRFGHIQRNCHELEKKLALERAGPSSCHYKKTKHKVNSVNTRGQSDDTDSDEVGLVVRDQHVLSADVTNKQAEIEWIVDSGATSHVCHDRSLFTELQNLEKPLDIILGDGRTLNGRTLNATGCGSVIVMLESDSLKRKCKFYDVLYVPELTYNLLSVSKAVDKGISFTFNESECVIKDSNQKLITIATKAGSLYRVAGTMPKEQVHSVTKKNDCSTKEDLWHRRYGHLGVKSLQQLSRDNMVEGFDYNASNDISFCEPCLKGKHRRSQSPLYSEKRKPKPLELIHSDVCGKISSKSLGRAEYFVTFIDDKTRYVWAYAIKKKSDVFQKFCEWKAEVEKSLGQSVKILRTDNGGEFTSDEFEKYLKKEGIKHQLTIPKCPEQNGVAERFNRTLVEMVRSMLADSELPKSFWAEALATAVYLRNRSPTKPVEGKTPYEAIYGEKPKVKHLRVFGCTAYSHIPKDERQKLDAKARKCIFLGYPCNRKGYRLYDQSIRRVIHSRDVRFNESVCGFEKEFTTDAAVTDPKIVVESISDENKSLADDSSEPTVEKQTGTEENSSEPEGESTEPTVRRSQRETRRPNFYGELVNTAKTVSEPTTVEEALSCSEKQNWKEAMKDEFQSLQANQVWDLVTPPKDCKVINCKWVFKCKLGEHGQVERYKARLVAQGYSQRPGIDYEETFSPVVRFESVRSVIALAVHGNMKLHQMDVKTAFLNGELHEEVFIRQPEGFIEKDKENLVCRLKKSIYGLKQSPRCWNIAIDDHLKKMKFVQTEGDPCLYVSRDDAETVFIAVYVDDILIAAKTDKRIDEVKAAIASRFKVKDLGELHYFLGDKIVQDLKAGTIWLGQPAFSENILRQFNMQDAKSCKTPVNPGLKLTKANEESTLVNQELYQSAVGKLLYLSTRTRPDIAYAVSTAAKFTAKPSEEHWKAVKHILRYIAGTINLGLQFTRGGSIDCTGFADADWAGDIDDRKSTSGYLFKVGGGPVSWRSRKQNCVALSTAEAEYMSLTLAAQEAIWLNRSYNPKRSQPNQPSYMKTTNQLSA